MSILENETLRLTVRPDLGGRIDDIQDINTGKKWLYHPNGYEAPSLRSLPIGAPFDKNWSGGWEEMFPNDAACNLLGRELPDHGELWSQTWKLEGSSSHELSMIYSCQTVPVTVRKAISLSRKRPKFEIKYSLINHSSETLPFLLKMHPALIIEPGDQIVLPQSMMEPVDLGFSRLIGRRQKTAFPVGLNSNGEKVRIDTMPDRKAMTQEFVYATELEEGWCAIKNHRTRTALNIKFDLESFPYVWIFQSHGSWNGHYVLMLEPCTNVPYDLAVAMKKGTCAMLSGYGVKDFYVTVELGRGAF